MKRCFLIAMVLCSWQLIFAYQFDVILTKSRQQIRCVIVSQDEASITYRLADAQNDQTFVLSRSDIAKIYPRSDEEQSTQPQVTDPPVSKQNAENKPIEEAKSETEATPQAENADNQNKNMASVVADGKVDSPSDIIVTNDATRIEAIIVEVNDTEIKYRKKSNPTGPLYTKSTNDIAVVLYANGESEVFSKNTAQSNQSAQTTSPANYGNNPPVDHHRPERGTPEDREWAGGGQHTDKHGNTRTDFPGGHKTVRADGSTEISVPFVTIRKEGGGQGVNRPASDDITGFQVIDFYDRVEDDVIIINKSSNADYFKVAVCSVKDNQYFWKIVLVTTELKPYNKNNTGKQKEIYKAKTEDELNKIMPTKDRYLYSIAVKSRYGYEYSFKTYVDGDDVVIEVLDPNSRESDW